MKNKLLSPAKNQTAYLKMGIFGFTGSGKTFTSSNIAIGLHQYIQSKKPIAFLDSEIGSDFVLKKFNENKIKLVVCKSKAYIDLIDVIQEAEKTCDILIIDSLTHFWRELMEAYKRKKNITRITIQHWMDLKTEWQTYSELFINSKLHIIACGRAGDIWKEEIDEEGFSKLVKEGTKMKVESEFGYEPSLLCEMERVRKDNKIGSTWIHRCHILKDRADILTGKFFDEPIFDNFLPHVQFLNLRGEHIGIDSSRTSEELINNNHSRIEYHKQKEIILEEIDVELTLRYGKSREDNIERIELLKNIFGTASAKAIRALDLEKLKDGLKKIKNVKERRN